MKERKYENVSVGRESAYVLAKKTIVVLETILIYILMI